MQARYYDPVIGRFYSNDPVGFRDVHSFNRYAYANNNPYKYIDPDGNENRMAVSAAADTRAFTSGKISRGELSGRMTARAAAARTVLRNTPAGRTVNAVLTVASIVLNESSDDSGGERTADDPLPRDENGNPVPESDNPHTQLGTKKGRKGSYPQGREFGANGEHVKDIDFTDHGRGDHPNPHEHPIVPNETGGTPKRGPARPLNEEQ